MTNRIGKILNARRWIDRIFRGTVICCVFGRRNLGAEGVREGPGRGAHPLQQIFLYVGLANSYAAGPGGRQNISGAVEPVREVRARRELVPGEGVTPG
jgi:hypothetical protein